MKRTVMNGAVSSEAEAIVGREARSQALGFHSP